MKSACLSFLWMRGRVGRAAFWGRILLITTAFAGSFLLLEALTGHASTWVLYPPFLWTMFTTLARRSHDLGRSSAWLVVLALPILGPLWVAVELFFRKGTVGENRYGDDPHARSVEYLSVPHPASPALVNDVTGLNPVPVSRVIIPESVEQIQEAIRSTTGPISLGGGRFSMGGQIGSPSSLHLDLRKLNRVLDFSPSLRTIRVQAGIRWCDIQSFVDPHGLSVKIMQSYANPTVGGSLSVNCHGRYVGLGPIILSVRSISVVLPSGERVEASPTTNSEIFYGVIGGYGGLGIIVEADLDLSENIRVERISTTLRRGEYPAHFRNRVRGSATAVFHNADLYPPGYERLRSVTWVPTPKTVTQPHRLMPVRRSHPLNRYFLWAFTETRTGKWRREFLLEPLLYLRRVVHWRNYEAGYDVGELEPSSREHSTYVLQEYFVPVAKFGDFVPKLAEILGRHHVNVLNVSVRHAIADPGSTLAWAREEVFAFVLYYKQGVQPVDRERVAVWTRELIDAAIGLGGAYYLPYQAHATPEQFHRAYPRARELFELKRRIDPDFRLRNVIWDRYYAPTFEPAPAKVLPRSDFHEVYSGPVGADRFYRFLQNIFHLFPEDRFHSLIREAVGIHSTDEAIYRHLQEKLPGIKPFLADLTYAIPALRKQKREMARQTLELLGDRKVFQGYVEIGSTGRYVSELRKHVSFAGRILLVNDVAPTHSPADLLERGQISKLGEFVPMENYKPIDPKDIPDASVDLVTCYIGLHHIAPERLDGFVRSIGRILRPGGIFILRDHDVRTPELDVLVRLAHTVFNAGLRLPWEENRKELRHFGPMEHWIRALGAAGLHPTGPRLLQANDPTDNMLVAFVKGEPEAAGRTAAAAPAVRETSRGVLRQIQPAATALLLTGLCLGAAAGQEPASVPITPPEHRRGEDQTFLTYPEWFLVFSPAEVAAFLKTQAPSEFPYFGHIRQFWHSYHAVKEELRGKYPYNSEYHTMIVVIGLSTTCEYALKGTWELVFGRVTEATRLHGLTAEDRFAARMAQDYVDFIRMRPWYEYDFIAKLKGLWSETGFFGHDLIRKWERKYILTTEYAAKAVYGWLIRKATQASFAQPVPETAIVLDRLPPAAAAQLPALKVLKSLENGSVLALVPRYEAFTQVAATLAREGVQFLEIAGNRSVILVTALVPSDWSAEPGPSSILFAQPILTQPGTKRMALKVPVADLSRTLRSLEAPSCRLEHVFDY